MKTNKQTSANLNGYIRWFDNLKGEGVVTVPEHKKDYFVHWSADARLDDYENKSLSGRTDGFFVTYNSLDLVEVDIFFDSHYEQVCRIAPKDWTTHEELLSEKLLEMLDENHTCSEEWFNFCLNNLLQSIDKYQKSAKSAKNGKTK